MCVTPRTPPTPGGNVAMPPPPANDPSYNWDKNGCLPSYPSDSCAGRSVLSGPTFAAGRCCYAVCMHGPAPCGRPLLLDDAARTAPVVVRADWCAPLESDAPIARSPAKRDAWLADAAMEHASVASFARFALELLAVGAPAELVAAAHRAALDEVEHARLAFAVAARHGGGDPMGPGPLDVTDLRVRTSLAAIAASAVVEGCVGETRAALAAARARDAERDPVTAAALARIADDELAHAELAWTFVAWAIARDPSVRDPVLAAFGALDTDELFAPGVAQLRIS